MPTDSNSEKMSIVFFRPNLDKSRQNKQDWTDDVMMYPTVHFRLPWRGTPGAIANGIRDAMSGTDLFSSMCKISGKSVQQFRKRCVPNRQTDRQIDRQTANLIPPPITMREIITPNYIGNWPFRSSALSFPGVKRP